MPKVNAFPDDKVFTPNLQALSMSRVNWFLKRKISKILKREDLQDNIRETFGKFQAELFKEKSAPLHHYVEAIVRVYDHSKAGRKPFEAWKGLASVPLEDDKKVPFELSSYHTTSKNQAAAAKALGKPDEARKKVPENQRAIFLIFLFRTLKCDGDEYPEIAVLTTHWGWEVVRKCIDYRFPITLAQNLSSFDRVLECERVSMIQPTHVQSFRQKDDVALYGMEWLYSKYMHFSCLIRDKCSLIQYDKFKDLGEKIVLRIGEGSFRIQEKLNIPEWAEVFHILFETYKKACNEEDGPNPEFEYLLFVNPAEVEKSKLNEAFTVKLLKSLRGNDFDSFSIQHKRSQDFLDAHVYTVSLGPRGGKVEKEWVGAPPRLREIVDLYREKHPGVFESDTEEESRSHLDMILKGTITFGRKKSSIFDLLQGLVFFEDRTFFRFRRVWFQTSGEHYSIVQELFIGLLNRVYRTDEAAALTIPWSGVHDKGDLTQKNLTDELGVIDGVTSLFQRLAVGGVYLDAQGQVVQTKLFGDILEEPLVKKYKKQIEKWLKTQQGELKSLVPEQDAIKILELLKKPYLNKHGEVSYLDAQGQVVQKKLYGDILEEPLVKKYRKEIEEWLETQQGELKSLVPEQDAIKILELLGKPFPILRDLKSGNTHEWVVINPWLPPHFDWPEQLSIRTKAIEEVAREKIKKINPKERKEKTLKKELAIVTGSRSLATQLTQDDDIGSAIESVGNLSFEPTDQTRQDLVALLERKNKRFLGWMKESKYNQLYLEKSDLKEGEGWITGDCVTPMNVELFDILHFIGNELFLIAVKEELGQKTREAVSQLLTAAKKLRAALDHPQSKNIIDAFWEKANQDHTGPNANYLNKLKERMQTIGEAGFKELFTRKKITFVYACLDGKLEREKNLRIYCRESDFAPFVDENWTADKIYDFLTKKEYLDKRGRLTAKFALLKTGPHISNIPFPEPVPEKVKDITSFLGDNFFTGSASIIAKLELFHAEKELRALGFNFAIVEIPRLHDGTELPPLSQEPTYTQFSQPSLLPSQSPAAPAPPSPYTGFPRKKEGNTKNICYVNTFVQWVLNTPELSRSAKNYLSNQNNNAAQILREICNVPIPPKNGPEKLRDALFEAGWKPMKEKFEQQDIHDLFYAFEIVFTDVQINIRTQRRAEQNDNFIVSSPQQLERYICVEVPDSEKGVNLQDLINNTFNWEKKHDPIGPWKCDLTQKTHEEWEEKVELLNNPDMVILHLNRQEEKDGKVNTSTIFPDNKRVVLNGEQYQITSVVCHDGFSFKEGHYTALLFHDEAPIGWYLCDDEKIKTISGQELQVKAGEAYLIAIRKVKV